MRFVHIEDFFHPSAGYQLNLLGRLQVKEGHEVIIITSEIEKVPDFLTSFFGKDDVNKKDEDYYRETGVKIYRLPVYFWYSGRAIFKLGLKKFIKSLDPDVLFIHGEDTLTGIRLLFFYSTIKLPFVLDCHMLEMASKNKFRELFRSFFRLAITPIILKNNITLIRVVDSDFVEKHFNIPLSKTILLSFGTDTDFFKPDDSNKIFTRNKLNIDQNDFVVLYAGKLDKDKGGMFLAEMLRKKIILNNKNIKFVVIGNVPNDNYGHEVNSLLEQSENSIIRLGTQTYLDLVNFYQMSDIAIYPRQCSMSYFEAQSSGLPVVLEINEINVSRVDRKKGLLFSEGSIEEFRQAIVDFGNMEYEEFLIYKNNSRANIVSNYNYVPIAKNFSEVMIQSYEVYHSKF
jgi:glycosyltransferase involved in cell wall biosynthesis